MRKAPLKTTLEKIIMGLQYPRVLYLLVYSRPHRPVALVHDHVIEYSKGYHLQ